METEFRDCIEGHHMTYMLLKSHLKAHCCVSLAWIITQNENFLSVMNVKQLIARKSSPSLSNVRLCVHIQAVCAVVMKETHAKTLLAACHSYSSWTCILITLQQKKNKNRLASVSLHVQLLHVTILGCVSNFHLALDSGAISSFVWWRTVNQAFKFMLICYELALDCWQASLWLNES